MLAITNAKIFTVSGPVIASGILLIENGKIAAVGENIPIPAGADIFDAQGKTIMPGIVEAHCHLSVMDFGDGWDHDCDGADAPSGALGPAVTPDLESYYAFDPRHAQLKDALASGITTILTRPGSGKIVAGMGLIAKTHGKSRKEMVIMNPAEVKMAFGENPKRNFGSRKMMPSTRMGSAALLRDALTKARAYMKKKANAKPDDVFAIDYKLEPLVKVLTGELKARVHAHRADDIMTILRISDEFGFQLSIEHASEAHLVIDEILKRNVPCVLGPTFARSKVETRNKNFASAGQLERAGVTVAITTDAPVVPAEYLRTCVSLCYREGMSEEGAIKSMTLTAAEIIGVSDRLGSLDVGKDADIIMLNGHPLSFLSRVERVWINGDMAFDIDRDKEDWE